MFLSKFTVSGHSMIPTFYPGQTVLVSNLPYKISPPKTGDIIVFKKGKIALIKRIRKITREGIVVVGDNKKDSLKSSEMGIISLKQVLGKVIIKL